MLLEDDVERIIRLPLRGDSIRPVLPICPIVNDVAEAERSMTCVRAGLRERPTRKKSSARSASILFLRWCLQGSIKNWKKGSDDANEKKKKVKVIGEV